MAIVVLCLGIIIGFPVGIGCLVIALMCLKRYRIYPNIISISNTNF